MKIISKFKDYYDSISHQYLDKEIIYTRENKEIEIKAKGIDGFWRNKEERDKWPPVATFDRSWSDWQGLNQTWHRYSIRFAIIGFCGNMHQVIQVIDESNVRPEYYGFYDADSFEKFRVERNIGFNERTTRWWPRGHYRANLDEAKQFFVANEKFEILHGVFREYNTPAFVLYDKKESVRVPVLEINPTLKNYQFAKVKDPYTAHQDLYTFVSGFLKQPDKPMVEISDEDKIHKHGYNEWSFRKLPTKKRK